MSLFAYDIMLYIGNPKDFNKILLKLMNEFSNLPDYKISIEKSVAFWYMNNELSKKEIRKTIPFK